MIVKAQESGSLYEQTMECGGFDLDSEVVLVPRGISEPLKAEAKPDQEDQDVVDQVVS